MCDMCCMWRDKQIKLQEYEQNRMHYDGDVGFQHLNPQTLWNHGLDSPKSLSCMEISLTMHVKPPLVWPCCLCREKRNHDRLLWTWQFDNLIWRRRIIVKDSYYWQFDPKAENHSELVLHVQKGCGEGRSPPYSLSTGLGALDIGALLVWNMVGNVWGMLWNF